MSHEMSIETFAKIHKWFSEQEDIKEYERINILGYIASEYLN